MVTNFSNPTCTFVTKIIRQFMNHNWHKHFYSWHWKKHYEQNGEH